MEAMRKAPFYVKYDSAVDKGVWLSDFINQDNVCITSSVAIKGLATHFIDLIELSDLD